MNIHLKSYIYLEILVFERNSYNLITVSNIEIEKILASDNL